MFPKPKSYKDKKYIKYIQSLPCVVGRGCFGDIVAHHVEAGGMGMKCSDYKAAPLCQAHHTPGNDSIHHLGLSRFEERHNVDLWMEIFNNLEHYVGEKMYAD